MDYWQICRNCLRPYTNEIRGQLDADFEHESTAYTMKRNTRRYW
jgi:hypothetical protein